MNSRTAGTDLHVPFGGIRGSGRLAHKPARAAIELHTEPVTGYERAPRA
jgi:hypothetical protein